MSSGIDLGIAQLADAVRIGRGGFSTVYAATDTQFDRRVAVKVLGHLERDSDRARFERECRVMGRLSSHPNVVTVYSAGYTDDDKPYLIMELVSGGSLADQLTKGGRLPWREAATTMIGIARAVQHAHDAGVLHRDIKPENILIGNDIPHLTDFGIAYLRDATGSTSTGITASWQHAAPETFDDLRDERSDVYSAASTLYTLIVGKAPFEDPTDESLKPLMRRLLYSAPPDLPTGFAPVALGQYIKRALAKSPDDRPQTADELADGLQHIVDTGGHAPPASGPPPSQASGGSQPVPPAGSSTPQGGRSSMAVGLAAFVLLAIVGVVVLGAGLFAFRIGTAEVPADVPPEEAKTFSELEDQWAANREAIVAELSRPEYGVGDDNVLRGPGGLAVSLAGCSPGWSDTTGVTDNSITIGQAAPLTGQNAWLGTIGDGMEAYFEYVNSSGGIDGRTIEFLRADDEYDAALTATVVDNFVNDEGVFAVMTAGSEATLATRDQLVDDCVPHLFNASSHPGLADTEGHPFTTGLLLNWAAEAALWGSWIDANRQADAPIRVGALVHDSAFGTSYADPFRQWSAANPGIVGELIEVRHDPEATSLEAEVAELAAAQPDVVLVMTSGPHCAQATEDMAAAGLPATVDAAFLPSVCVAPELFAGSPEAADGFYVFASPVTGLSDPAEVAADPFLSLIDTELRSRGLDPTESPVANGYGLWAWTWVETMRIASQLPGGLSRTNLILAAHSLDLDHPKVSDQFSFSASGPADPHYLEGGLVRTFDGATADWGPGVAFDRNGVTPPCPWTGAGCY